MAAGWLLLSFPVFVVMLYIVVEVGQLWRAQEELRTALEAAALAGAQEWADTGTRTSARTAAVNYAHANSVAGTWLVLDRNESLGAPNDNRTCTGDIVLGEVTGVPCNAYEFDANATPGAITGTFVSLTVDVTTTTDTRNDVVNGEYPFKIHDFSSSNAGIEIESVTVNLGSVPTAGTLVPQFFDLRIKTSGVGIGTDKDYGVVPTSSGLGVVGHVFTPGAGSGTSATFQVRFTGSAPDNFAPGTPIGNPSADRFWFGVDTDGVGPDSGTGDGEYADVGGDFDGATVTVTFRLAGGGATVGSVSGVMGSTGANSSVVVFNNQELRSGTFGVRTKKSIHVEPIFQKLLGVPFTGYQVSAEAFAMCPAGEAPRLMRIASGRYHCSAPINP